jgi:hypothetical protein
MDHRRKQELAIWAAGTFDADVDPLGEVVALGWTIEDIQDDPQTSRDEARLYIAVVRSDKDVEVARVEVYSALRLLEAVARAERFPDESLKAWRRRAGWRARNSPEL